MSVVEDWVSKASREELVAMRDKYNADAAEAWHGRDNGLRQDMLRAINRRLSEMPCATAG